MSWLVAELLLGDFLESLCQQRPELACRGPVGALARCVGRQQRRAERADVEAGILGEDDAALQSCVNHLHLRLVAEQVVVDFAHALDEFAVGVGVPSAVSSAELNLHASHVEATLK